eukprot:tig00000448_g865.t1
MATSPAPTTEERLRLHRAVQSLIDDLGSRVSPGWSGAAIRAVLQSTRYHTGADGVTEMAELPASSLVALSTMLSNVEDSMKAKENHVRLLEAKVALLIEELRTKDEQLETLWEESRRKPGARDTNEKRSINRDPVGEIGMLRWFSNVLEEVFCGKFGCFSCFEPTSVTQPTTPGERRHKLAASELLPPRPSVSAEEEGEQITERHVDGETPRTVVASPRQPQSFASPRFDESDVEACMAHGADRSCCGCPLGGAKIAAVLPSSPSATVRYATAGDLAAVQRFASAAPAPAASPSRPTHPHPAASSYPLAQPPLLPPGSFETPVVDVGSLALARPPQ